MSDITDWLLVGIGALNVTIVFLLLRISARSLWLMGSSESHSSLDSQIKARELQKEGVKVVWWDPSIHKKNQGRKWPRKGEHGEEFNLEMICLGIPEEDRAYQPSRIIRIFRGF